MLKGFFLSNMLRRCLIFSSVPVALYLSEDYFTKKHDPARCIFHVCLGRIPNLREDVVKEFSGSSASFIHLVYDTTMKIKSKYEVENSKMTSTFEESLDDLIKTLKNSKNYHHQFFKSFMTSSLDEYLSIRKFKFLILKLKLMNDIYIKKCHKLIIPIETYYKVEDENAQSGIIGHRSYIVINQDKREFIYYDTSQLNSSLDNLSNYERPIAIKFDDVDYSNFETINSIVNICIHKTVPLSSKDVANYNDNEVERIVNEFKNQLSPYKDIDFDPHFIRKGQLYGTCTYSPIEKMISTWYKKEDAQQLKMKIRKEIFSQYIKELEVRTHLDRYIVQIAKAIFNEDKL